ncbi:MAG: glycosyl hydrolase family 28-related protein [Candidatus Odinarchaeota archaeon]
MGTLGDKLVTYSTDAQLSHFFINKAGYIFVSSYGAVGDGVTDDTEAVQNAIDAAVSAGKTEVHFVGGKTYLLGTLTSTSGLTFIGDNVTITGTSGITVVSFGSHLSYIVNVKDYGAIGNGTTDDTTAIQSAVDAITNGGIVYFPAGTYIISNQITINYDYIKLIGTGSASVIKAKNDSDFQYMISATSKTGIYIENLKVDANKSGREPSLTTRTVGIYFASCIESIVINCLVVNTIGSGGATNIPGVGIALGGSCSRCQVKDSAIRDCGVIGKAADAVYTAGTQNLIVGCIANNCLDTGFVLEKSNYCGIIGCTTYDCSSGAGITNGTDNDIYGNFIDGLTIYNYDAANTGAVQVGSPVATATGHTYNTILSNIIIERVSGSGPAILIRKTNAVLGDGNTNGLSIENVRIKGAGTQGIVMNGANDVIINGVDIENTTNGCIQANSTCSNIVIFSSYLRNMNTSFGIYISDVDTILIQNCRIKDCSWGIYFAGTCTNARSFLNTITDTSSGRVGSDAGTIPQSVNMSLTGQGFVFDKSEDTILYRSNANILKTDDKFIAALGIGVGNSAAASALGALSKKIEVFDSVGVSIGFIPVYATIT